MSLVEASEQERHWRKCPMSTSSGWSMGTSLLQAGSRMSVASFEDATLPQSGSSGQHVEEDSSFDMRQRVGLLVVISVVATLVLLKLYSDSSKASVERVEEPDIQIEGEEDVYDAVYQDESDSGDMQIDDLVGATLGTPLGDLVPLTQTAEVERTVYDPESVRKHIDEAYGSWNLMKSILVALLEFWAALAFMYWSLLYKDEELMNCTDYPMDRPHGFLVRNTCFYTLACLRGFPILAANMVLVLMIRIIVQTRMYYCMLRLGYVLHFVSAPVLRTIWPWACGASMFQGGLHFALKAYFAPEGVELEMMYVRLVRKFVLPGTIFFSFLLRYADIENTLVPLNRICEHDLTKDKRDCPWLSNIHVLNERVLAFDARHRDVVGATERAIGKAPTINDIVQNMLDNYDNAYKYWSNRKHRNWGLFRSMWPASVFLDRRLDRQDRETRAWLTVFAILVAGCSLVSVGSMYLLFFRMLFVSAELSISTLLANAVLVIHGLLIMLFIYRTIQNMFYHAFNASPKAAKGTQSIRGYMRAPSSS